MSVEWFIKMDGGLGIGGLNISQHEVASSNFDVFVPVEVDTSIHSTSRHIARPISASTSQAPRKFHIPPDPDKWTNADSLRLHGKVRINAKNGEDRADLPAGAEVSVVNNFYQSLWGGVNIKINGADLSDPSSKWYAYKSYLEDLLSYSPSTKDNRLKSNCYYKDSAGVFDVIGILNNAKNATATQSTNDGYTARKEFFKLSRWKYFCINLHSDITTLRKYIPPNVGLEIEFNRNSDDFSLMTPHPSGTYSIEIENTVLTVDRYTPSPSVQEYYFKKMASHKKAWLPIDRSLIKTHTVQPGTSDLSCYNVIRGQQLPDQIIIGLLTEKAHRGEANLNPFNFQHFNLAEASILVNGVHEPREPHKVDIDAGDYISLYSDFLENTGIGVDDRDFGVSMNDYIGGSFLIAFDRTRDKCNRFHRHQADSGTIDVNIRLKSNITETVVVLIYATYSGDLVVDDFGNVSMNNF